MKALLYMGKDTLKLEDVPAPQAGPGEVLIRVRFGGICGSDLSIVAGKHPRARPPLILGHEGAGVIAALGDGAGPEFREGDPVVVEPLITCGRCVACRSGFSHVCQRLGLYGIDAPGAFAEYLKVPAHRVRSVPREVPLDVAALVEPIAVAVHAVRMSRLRLGDTVCVLGAGPIGLLTALVARLAGPARVLVAEKQPYRLALAASFGFETVDAGRQDLVEAVFAASEGRGADIVFEVAGVEATVLAAPRLCRPRGEVVSVSNPKVPVPVDLLTYSFREISMTGVRVYEPYDFERAIHIVSTSGLDFRKLLSDPLPLEQAEAAFARAREGKDAMKILLRIGG